MGRYDFDDEFDELDLRRPGRLEQPHSGTGVASLVVGIVAAVGTGCAMVILAALDAAQPGPDDDLWAGLIVLLLLGSGTLSVTGLVLGLVGSFKDDRNPLFGIVGTIVNTLAILGLGVVLCLGLLSDL